MPDTSVSYDFLRPLVTGWLSKINLAIQAKQEWQDVADQCQAFYAGSVGFMWEEKYRRKFLKGNISPKFRLSLNKAFEIVALFGPVLYHRNPIRACRPHKRADFPPEIVAQAIGVPAADYRQLTEMVEQIEVDYGRFGSISPEQQQAMAVYGQVQRAMEEIQAQENGERLGLWSACQVMEQYLSYTPREQPNGGLEQASEDAITEMLIKGRGTLWPRSYRMPGSDRQLTGCFYESADALVSDPDAKTFNFGDTKWIALEHWNPSWEVERLHRLPAGTLKGKGKLESSEMQANRRTKQHQRLERQNGGSFDLVQWWEVWSLGGVGTRLSGVSKVMNEAFDHAVGDYAYLCVCEGVPYPLNATSETMRSATYDDVLKAFSWPVPYHLDQRWPCSLLETYREPNSPYPIAPLKPGLGELTFLNIVISNLCGRIYEASRLVMAVQQGAKTYVDRALNSSEDRVVIELKNSLGDINKIITELDRKDVPFDVWRMVDAVFELFDKRVGLSDLYYGMNPGGAVSRSATDIRAKEEKLSIRPDHMSKKVDGWMSETARMEKLCAYWSGVSGHDVRPLLGTIGSRVWDQLIVEAPPDLILHEMDATVEAGTAAKPNRERDLASVNQMFPALIQELSKHADVTTDTGPVNQLIQQLGEKLDAPDKFLQGIKMGPRTAPAPPEGGVDPEAAELEADQAEHEQEMQQSEEEHDQKLRHQEESHDQQMLILKTKARMARLNRTTTAAA